MRKIPSVPIVDKMLRKGRLPKSDVSVYPGRYSVGYQVSRAPSGSDPKALVVTWSHDFTDKEAVQDPEVARERALTGLHRCESILEVHFDLEMVLDPSRLHLVVKRRPETEAS